MALLVNSRYEELLNLPENANVAEAVKNATIAIEKYTKELEDTLPKDISAIDN